MLNYEDLENLKLASSPMEPKVDLTHSDATALGREDTTRYRHIIGSLQYMTTTTLDISFIVSKLSQFFANPTTCHLQALQ